MSTAAPPVATGDIRRVIAAIRSDDVAALRKLLEDEERLARHPRAVNEAARRARADGFVQAARPDVPDAEGWTAVHQAASRGNARLMAAVLAAGGDRRREERKGRTPLVIATRSGRAKVVELLIGTRSCA